MGEPVELDIRTAARQAPRPEPDKLLPQVKNVIAVASGKGGVGKSTVSANLAVGLSMLGYKVGLLDADVYGPSAPKMFQLEDYQPTAERIDGRDLLIPAEQYGVKVLSVGFFVDPGSATVWRGSMASSAVKQLIGDANWGELDYLVIDMPPGTSDIHLTIVQTLGLTGAVVVSTPQQVALADARKGIDMFANEKINVPVLGLVENMAWFTPAELPEPLLPLRARGRQAAGCRDGRAAAGPDSCRAEYLRERRPGRTHRAQLRLDGRPVVPEPRPGRRDTDQPAQRDLAQDDPREDGKITYGCFKVALRLL